MHGTYYLIRLHKIYLMNLVVTNSLEMHSIHIYNVTLEKIRTIFSIHKMFLDVGCSWMFESHEC